MKIVLTGGGTGGHFYPLVAVAEQLNELIEEEHLLNLKLFYLAPQPYDEQALFNQRIEFRDIPSGKLRIYFSLENFFDMFSVLGGIIKAFFTLFFIYPDVVFSKGGYASFPTVFSARLLGIPVVMHESDSVPGRVNARTGKFARRIAVSYPETAEYFDESKVAVTGQPVRQDVIRRHEEGAFEYLQLEPNTPVLLILGGSQGAQKINEVILSGLLQLVDKYQIIHQVGSGNEESVKERAGAVLGESENRYRYKVYGFLDSLSMSMAGSAASVVLSRAGSTIFEIAAWGVPSILVPFEYSYRDHTRKNAYNYARRGACTVVEEQNLAPYMLRNELDRIVDDNERWQTMKENAQNFFESNAANKIAKEIISIGLEHD